MNDLFITIFHIKVVYITHLTLIYIYRHLAKVISPLYRLSVINNDIYIILCIYIYTIIIYIYIYIHIIYGYIHNQSK